MMRSTGVWFLDEVFGGIRPGKTYEVDGYPWNLLKEVMHRVVAHLSMEGRVVIIYGQYFDGLDPYLLIRIGREEGLDTGLLKRNIRLARCFKGEDMATNIRRGVKTAGYLVVVDPYLHTYMTERSDLYPMIASELYRAKMRGRGILIFNRIRWDGKPLGGSLHRHSLDYVARLVMMDRLIHVELVKALDRPPISFAVDASNPWRRRVQHLLDRWI